MRCQPDFGELEELVGETNQCRYGTGEGSLALMRGMKMSGVVVVVNFILHRIQPYKERAHAGFDFKGDTDGPRERTEKLMKEAMLHRAAELFTPNMSYTMPGQPKPFNCMNSSP